MTNDKNLVIEFLKKNNGLVSTSAMTREGLNLIAPPMVSNKELLLGRHIEKRTYYYGLPHLKENLDIDVRWLIDPIIKKGDK